MIDKDCENISTKEKIITKLIVEIISSIFVFIFCCVSWKLFAQTETWLRNSIVMSIFYFIGCMIGCLLNLIAESKEVSFGTIILYVIVMCIFWFFISSFITGVILELKEWYRIPIMCAISFFISSHLEVTTKNKKSNL